MQAQHEKLFQPLLSGFGLDRYYFSSGFNTRKFQKEASKYNTLGPRPTRILGQIGTKLFDSTLNEVKFQICFLVTLLYYTLKELCRMWWWGGNITLLYVHKTDSVRS